MSLQQCCRILAAIAMTPFGAFAATLIEHATLLPMTGSGPLTGHAVLVDAGRIVAVGPADGIDAPEGTIRIDAAGGFLIPGLGDMHVHLVNPEREPFSSDMLALYVAKGITTVRSMWGGPGHLALRERIQRDNLPAPSLVLAGPGFGSDRMTAEEAAALTTQQARQGWDLVKMHWKPRAEVYDAVMTSAAAHGIEVSGHVPYAISLSHALARQQRTIEHLDGYLRALADVPEAEWPHAAAALARQTRKAGTAVVPTLFAWEVYLEHLETAALNTLPELDYVPAAQRERWNRPPARTWRAWVRHGLDALTGNLTGNLAGDTASVVARRQQLLRIMADEGVEILFGSDATQPFVVPGFSLGREMQALLAAGLTSAQALTSATAAVGRYLAERDSVGIIAAGARADLVLLDANPMDDIEALDTPRGVMLRGRWYDRAWIEQTLGTVRDRQP